MLDLYDLAVPIDAALAPSVETGMHLPGQSGVSPTNLPSPVWDDEMGFLLDQAAAAALYDAFENACTANLSSLKLDLQAEECVQLLEKHFEEPIQEFADDLEGAPSEAGIDTAGLPLPPGPPSLPVGKPPYMA